MYLQKLEIQGFKSFATRVVLEFPSANGHGKGMTAVVGPNGSGKSNIADAIRWVLGEQSMKTLRGKRSEDVIFFGSDRRGKVGMAEVSLYLNNEDHRGGIELSEIVITRRLYRSGESEYLVNKQKARLGDIQILLAKANFGQRTYSVIGQGMVDHFLVASQAERKEFFDEAAGVKEYQIKKQQTVNQLEHTRENLRQTDITLQELGPRYRSLSRMMKRLAERSSVEEELRGLQGQYYGALVGDLEKKVAAARASVEALDGELRAKQAAVAAAQAELGKLEQEDSRQEAFQALQKNFQTVLDKKNTLWKQQLELENKITLAREQARQNFIPLSADAMASELESLRADHQTIAKALTDVTDVSQIKKLVDLFGGVLKKIDGLLRQVRRPADTDVTVDEQLTAKLEAAKGEVKAVESEVTRANAAIAEFNQKADEAKGAFFELQRTFAARSAEANALSIRANDARIELAKLETKREDLERELDRESVDRQTLVAGTALDTEALDKIQRLKRQLEQIGGVDEESVKEYDEIKDRYEFLQTQYDDLTKALGVLEQIIGELDKEIHERFDVTFQQINQKFGEYFVQLFGGGKASLEKLMIDAATDDDEDDEDEDEGERAVPTKRGEQQYGGVEIRACPPGKKIASLNTLSGGERAMTSIALICAIIACNPSPFVVLDEVDAALDEANSDRYAGIIEELSRHTQFIVVTHNRATMRRGDVLYGVTMGGDSVSTLLSVKLEQGEQWAK